MTEVVISKVPCLKVIGTVTKFLFKSYFPNPVKMKCVYGVLSPSSADFEFWWTWRTNENEPVPTAARASAAAPFCISKIWAQTLHFILKANMPSLKRRARLVLRESANFLTGRHVFMEQSIFWQICLAGGHICLREDTFEANVLSRTLAL